MPVYQAEEGSEAFGNDKISSVLGDRFSTGPSFPKEIGFISTEHSFEALPCSSSHSELRVLPEPMANAICRWRTELSPVGFLPRFVIRESCACWEALDRGASKPRKLIPKHSGHITMTGGISAWHSSVMIW